MNILIVDDERMSRTVIARLIAKKFSFSKVSEAQNGIEALAMLEQDTFDLLIADLNMPGMGGLELLQVLRNDLKYQKLPVIVVSIVQDKNIIVKLIQLGIAGFLVKPLNIEAAQQRIGAILQSIRQAQQPESLAQSQKNRAVSKVLFIEPNIATRLLLLNFIGERCPIIFADNESELAKLIPEYAPSHVIINDDSSSGMSEKQMAKRLREQFADHELCILKYSNLDYLIADEAPFFDAVIQKSDNSSMFLHQLLVKIFNDTTPTAKLLHTLKYQLMTPLTDMLINVSPAFLNEKPMLLERSYIGRIDPDGAVRYILEIKADKRYKVYLSFEGRQSDIIAVAGKFVGAQNIISIEKATRVYSRFMTMLADKCSAILMRYGIDVEHSALVMNPGEMYNFPQVWDSAIPLRFQPDLECMLSICLRENS